MTKAGPRTLFYDLETSHNILASFSLFEKYAPIPFENILRERHIICAAWKWAGQRAVHAKVTYTANDSSVVKALSRAIQHADVIVAHNGNSFDSRYLRTRLLAHGLPPFAPAKMIDTYRVAKAQFYFNANRLDYLGHYLKVGRKIHTPRGLWLKALQGNHRAIDQMVRYNKGDVRLLERVYRKLQPFIPGHVNHQLFAGGTACPRCGIARLISNGVRQTLTRTYRRFRCAACGGHCQETHALLARATHLVL